MAQNKVSTENKMTIKNIQVLRLREREKALRSNQRSAAHEWGIDLLQTMVTTRSRRFLIHEVSRVLAGITLAEPSNHAIE